MTRRLASPKARGRVAARPRARLPAAWLVALALLSMCAPAGALAATGQRGNRRVDAQHAAPCEGSARRVRARHVRISFTCDEDVTWFEISANRTLHGFEEPESAFGCERASARSFRCQDIHSGAAPEGGGIATVDEPLCAHGARLTLRVTPAFDFEQPTGFAFRLRGPC